MPAYNPQETTQPNMALPDAGAAVTLGTAYRPNAAAMCFVYFNLSLTGLAAVNASVTIAVSDTAAFTTSRALTETLTLTLVALQQNRSVGPIAVPAGCYYKVTASALVGILPTLTVTALTQNFA